MSITSMTTTLLNDHTTLKEYSPTFHFHEDDKYAPMTLEQPVKWAHENAQRHQLLQNHN
jgi:hypothetical protein